MPGSPPGWGNRAVTPAVGGSSPSPGVGTPPSPTANQVRRGGRVVERTCLQCRIASVRIRPAACRSRRPRWRGTPAFRAGRQGFDSPREHCGTRATRVAVETERSFDRTRRVRIPHPLRQLSGHPPPISATVELERYFDRSTWVRIPAADPQVCWIVPSPGTHPRGTSLRQFSGRHHSCRRSSRWSAASFLAPAIRVRLPAGERSPVGSPGNSLSSALPIFRPPQARVVPSGEPTGRRGRLGQVRLLPRASSRAERARRHAGLDPANGRCPGVEWLGSGAGAPGSSARRPSGFGVTTWDSG